MPSHVPDLGTVASPTRRDLSYAALEPEAQPIGQGGQAVVYRATVNQAEPSTIALKESP